MGIHHYTLTVLPRAYFGEQLPAALTHADSDRGGESTSDGWWASHPPSERFLNSIRSLLPIEKSWGETEEYFSVDEWSSSDIRIWKEAGEVWCITFRFSPVADGWSLMQRFLSLMREEHCVLFEEVSGAIFEPDERIVHQQLVASRAMQFVSDPEGAIVQAARELKDDAG
ncbi:MAG: hypothetical protein ACK4UN_14085 [Limisphaerales bacterium]